MTKKRSPRKGYSYMRNGKLVVVPAILPSIPSRSTRDMSGQLRKYGYSRVMNTLAPERRKHLKKAAKKEGPSKVARRLDLIASYTKNTRKGFSRKLRQDATWLRKNGKN